MQKREVLKVLVFISICVAVLGALSAWEKHLTDYYYKALACEEGKENRLIKVKLVMENKVDPDIMVFGSSIALVHINPDSIETKCGKTCFNMGINGNFFPEYYGLVEEFTDNCKNCKTVVLCESFFSLDRHSALHKPEAFLHYINNEYIYSSLSKIDPNRCFKQRYVPFYNLISNDYETLKIGYAASKGSGWPFLRVNEKDRSVQLQLCDKGYKPVTKEFSTGSDSTMSTIIDNSVVDDFRITINKITAKGLKCIVVMPPIYKEGAARIEGLEKARSIFHSFEKRGSVYFIDYSTLPQLANSKENFYNNTHMNRPAAEKFSGILADSLKTLLNE